MGNQTDCIIFSRITDGVPDWAMEWLQSKLFLIS